MATRLIPALATAVFGLAPLGIAATSAHGQAGAATSEAVPRWAQSVPDLVSLVHFDRGQSDLRVAIERFSTDRAAILRRYDVQHSPLLRQRLRDLYQGWRGRLAQLHFSDLGQETRIDYLLLDSRLRFELEMLDEEERLTSETRHLVPFARGIQQLQEDRRDRKDIDARAAAQTLDQMADQVEALTGSLGGPRNGGSGPSDRVSPVVAHRAAEHLSSLSRTLQGWYSFYHGYDPLFTWWARAPYERLDRALQAYRDGIREKLVGIRPGQPEPIIGDPIGADGLRAHLVHEMIPYTPEELIAIAEQEFAWCEAELLRAAREMGFGDDWKAAQEAVKTLAVAPGEKPAVVRDLAYQSEAFLKRRGSITVPPLASEIWRMEMMSPEQQLVNPFFLGGEVIRISYPTDEMTHADKLMSMRGNNPHFNRATVHHELIPGHHLQGFMTSRFNSHRQMFSTPFWGEGWALYWEMVLWDQGFPRGPEDRIGMLFWRMHRAARIIFSLRFHMGTMTPQEAIQLLVDRVGHEQANAEAEVRRSFLGTYPPLYQAGYMLGGMQFRALRRELVDSGRMTEQQFHDAAMQGGRMPVEMVRARLLNIPLSRDHRASWRFAGDPLRR